MNFFGQTLNCFHRIQRVDRESVNDISGYSPELQAGLGYQINERTHLNVGYQMIWGKKTSLKIDADSETGSISHSPMQQSILVGFSYHF